MILFRVKVDFRGLQTWVALRRRALADLADVMHQAGTWLVADARRRLSERRSRYGSGRLARSLQVRPFKRSVTIASTLPYARIQQEGGIVRPRKRKMLAIPIAPDLARVRAWPKMFPKEQLFRRGNTLFFKRRRRVGDSPKGSVVPGWRLVKQAKIRGQAYLVKSAELVEYMRSLILRKLQRGG